LLRYREPKNEAAGATQPEQAMGESALLDSSANWRLYLQPMRGEKWCPDSASTSRLLCAFGDTSQSG
jgi:hypothetical protein